MLVDRPFYVGRNVLAGAGLRLPNIGECDAERRLRCGHDLAEAVTGAQNRVLAPVMVTPPPPSFSERPIARSVSSAFWQLALSTFAIASSHTKAVLRTHGPRLTQMTHNGYSGIRFFGIAEM
jgi:hypothetical protein